MRHINFANVVWMLLVHVGALAAPFYFTVGALWLFLALVLITGIAITLGYHRLLTHSSFKTYPVVRNIIALVGALAGEGPPTIWVATHRQHHQFADQPGDPHSPVLGGFSWAQWGWMVPKLDDDLIQRYAPDLARDCFMRFLHNYYLPLHIAFGALLFLIGGLPWLVWGVFVRIAFVLETTWLVNSASHIWGYRNYETNDNSRNCWPVALMTFGEGWHNNHHHRPTAANHGHYRSEFDLTYLVIRLLKKCGLVWDVVHCYFVDRPWQEHTELRVE